MDTATRSTPPTIDPIIVWPNGSPSLASMIADLQRLNPSLGLRFVTSTWTPDEKTIPPGFSHILSRATSEYLLYAGTALDVVTIAMPEPPNDEMMSGLTEVNREWGEVPTAAHPFQSGPRRIERTANGSLLIRPRSDAVESIFGRFAWCYQDKHEYPLGQIGRIQSRWGIFRDPYELWEVEFAYMPQYLFNRGPDGKHLPPDPRTPKGNFAFWRTIPVGTVSYIDRYDLSLETHFARAREIVAMGAEFAVVGDVEAGELYVFRLGGVTRTRDDIRIPEMDWFEVPAQARWDEQ